MSLLYRYDILEIKFQMENYKTHRSFAHKDAIGRLKGSNLKKNKSIIRPLFKNKSPSISEFCLKMSYIRKIKSKFIWNEQIRMLSLTDQIRCKEKMLMNICVNQKNILKT